jgi:DNA polymerase III sliding clamp (beta) subunit (PCNA family)
MSRPKMRAGYLKYEDGKLVMIGTDAFQLAYAEIEIEEDLSESLKDGILIAKEDLVRLRKILEVEDPSSNMKVTLQDNTISLEINNPKDSISTTIWLRLLGTEYVSYSVIFRDKGNEIVIEKQKLKSVLKRAAQALSKDSPILKFTVSPDSLLINSNDEYSSFSETMEVSYKADNTLLGVSSRYLNEMVPLIDSQFIVLDILTDEDVIIIHPVSDDETKDRKYFYILMPMDLN